MSDGGVATTAAAPAPAATTATTAQRPAGQQQQAGGQLTPELVPLVALTLVFAVVLVRALPWSDTARQKMDNVGLVLWPAVILGVAFGVWQSPLWAAFHVLPAAGLAVLLLGLYTRLTQRT